MWVRTCQAFQEILNLLPALERLRCLPDVVVVDDIVCDGVDCGQVLWVASSEGKSDAGTITTTPGDAGIPLVSPSVLLRSRCLLVGFASLNDSRCGGKGDVLRNCKSQKRGSSQERSERDHFGGCCFDWNLEQLCRDRRAGMGILGFAEEQCRVMNVLLVHRD